MNLPGAGHVIRYYREIKEGNIAGALVSALRAAGIAPAILNIAPRWLAEVFAGLTLRLDDRRRTRRYPPLRMLVPSIRFDFNVVREMQEKVQSFRSIDCEVLFVGGGESPPYFRAAFDALQALLPSSRRLILPGLDHSGPWNADRGGKPDEVAVAVRAFVRG